MTDETFTITIPNLQKLTDALKRYPAIAQPRFDAAFLNSKAALINHTKDNTPYKTGFLGNPANWTGVLTPMSLAWKPNASYAPFVEFGTKPHDIWPVNKLALYWPGAANPYKHVNHPGTKANDFMNRIAVAATPDIITAWEKALSLITGDIATQSQ